MRKFKIGDRVRVTEARKAEGFFNPYEEKGVVVGMGKVDRNFYIRVDHGFPGLRNEGWRPKSLEFDNDHRHPCACFECK